MNNDFNNRSPKDIDIYAGEQLKSRRQELGLSQKAVADSVGVTFQQIQKYEKGQNRIGASRLYEFCQLLRVQPSFFFQSMSLSDKHDQPAMYVADGIQSGENKESKYQLANSHSIDSAENIIQILKLYNNIKDINKQKLVLDLLYYLQDSNK